MAGWEMALVIIAITFMVVNMVNLVIQMIVLANFKDLFAKCAKMMSKYLDKSDKMMDQIFDDLED